MAQCIEFEMNGETLTIEYNRNSIVKMEELGYDALDPTKKIMTNYGIMVYGGLIMHQPKTTWKDAIEIADFLSEEYGLGNVIEMIAPLISDVFHLEGKSGKKLTYKGKKA